MWLLFGKKLCTCKDIKAQVSGVQGVEIFME
jgi:hypothetical protein